MSAGNWEQNGPLTISIQDGIGLFHSSFFAPFFLAVLTLLAGTQLLCRPRWGLGSKMGL
jgi:hypothetical protein